MQLLDVSQPAILMYVTFINYGKIDSINIKTWTGTNDIEFADQAAEN